MTPARRTVSALVTSCGALLMAAACAATGPAARAVQGRPHPADPAQTSAACAADIRAIEARLARFDHARAAIRARLQSAGFERTAADVLGDSAVASDVALETARSAAALDALLAGRTLAYPGLADEIDWVAVNWFDTALRRWTPVQIRRLAAMTATQFRSLKSETAALRQMLPEIGALQARQAELKSCAGGPARILDAVAPMAPERQPPQGALPVIDCEIAAAHVSCREAVRVKAVDPIDALRPLDSTSMSGEELSVLGSDSSRWMAFARDAAGGGSRGARVYVDGLPAIGNLPASAIGRVDVNADPFSAEYSGVNETRIDVELRPPDRRWNLSVSAPSLGAGGGSPLGPAGRPVSRNASIGVSGPLPRLPITFSVQATGHTDARRPLFIEPGSGALTTSADNVQTTSTSSALIVSGALVTGRVMARASFSGSAMHVSHAGIGGADGPTTGQRLDRADRAFQTTWRIADGNRIHQGGLSVRQDHLDAVADSLEPLTRITGQFVTGGDEVSASARRTAAWTLRHVIANGAGAWKAGFEGSRETVSDAVTPNPRGRFQLDAVDAGTATWIVSRGDSSATAHATSAAVFAERLAVNTSRATVRGGVRVDWQDGAGVIVAPRVLAAARVSGFQLSGGAGLFVQAWSPDLFVTVAHRGGTRATTFVVHDVPVETLEPLDSSLGVPLRTHLHPGFERRRDVIVRGGVRRRTGPLDAGIEHAWTRGESLPGAVRLRDAAGLVDAVASNRRLRRHQTHLRASWRRRETAVIAHYQRAWSYDDSAGAFAMPARTGDADGEWGRSSGVARHTGGVTAILRLPRKVRVSLQAQAHAGMPYTVITGRDSDGLATFTDRGGRPRNDGVLPPSFNLSLFVARTVRIAALNWLAFDAGVRADNLTDHRNITSVGSVIGTPMFGRPLDAAPGRSIRFWVALAR